MTRADRIVIVFSLILLPLVYLYTWQPETRATEARITDADSHSRIIRLDHDQTLHIHGKLGDSVLQVHDGKIRFIQSPCATKFCIHSGWLKFDGDVMACLPNGVYVEVFGGEKKFDSINF
ncbi:MAG: hypothetical protein GC149_08735 [Gammaproteobacteria bacterium]|nr:hypothetical protein [Gammaproteobacteria bacterium]